MKSSFFKTISNAAIAMSIAGFATACSERPAPQSENQPVKTQETSKETTSFQSLLETRINSGRGVGLAVSIVEDNQPKFINLGLAKSGSVIEITKDSLFEIGSITKTFTTIVLADMVVKGEVNLDDPASKYLPDTVKMPTYNGKEITLKHLATHTSSLPRMPNNFKPTDPENPYIDYTSEQMYAFLTKYEIEREIGKTIEYSNLGMGLLGHILAQHANMTYEELVTDRILKPLGMINTYMVVPDDKKSDFTSGHDVSGESAKHWDFAALAGAGAFGSSIADMTIYLQANMGLAETPLAEAMELSHKLHHSTSGEKDFIGLGWFTQNMSGKSATWHNGATAGYSSFLGFDKVNKRGVVVLANAQMDTDTIARAILTNSPETLILDQENKELKFSVAELERFVGDYQLAPTFIISITRKGTNLFLQATGQSKFPIFAKSEMEFFLKVVDASVIFKENEAGEITSLTLDQGGMMQPAKKL